VLGLSTENADICRALLSDLESRGLSLHPNVLFVTDGGSGIQSALKARYGKKLLHQRCVIHKNYGKKLLHQRCVIHKKRALSA